MRNLIKTGCWTAAIAGFLFLGANLQAQNRAAFRTNPGLYRQQNLARPFIAPQQPRIANPLTNFNQFGGYNPNANPYGGFGNFNQNSYYNPYGGYSNFNQTGYYNPYGGGFPNYNQTGYYNPYLGYPNFNQTGYYNPYASQGYYPQTAPGFFVSPFFGY